MLVKGLLLVAFSVMLTSSAAWQLSFIGNMDALSQSIPWSDKITEIPLDATLYCKTDAGQDPNLLACTVTDPANGIIVNKSNNYLINSDDDPIVFNIDVSKIPEPGAYPFTYEFDFVAPADSGELESTIKFSLTITDPLTTCTAGFYTTGGDCYTCARGTASDAAAATAPCPACPAGSAQPRIGQTSCVKCSPGAYSPEPGAAMCRTCPVGQEALEEGASSCTAASVSTPLPQEIVVAIVTIVVIIVFLGAFVAYRLKSNPARPVVGSKTASAKLVPSAPSESSKDTPSEKPEAGDDLAV